MRIAALYDIHANLPALEAALEDVRRAQVDQIVIGGDVLPGPMPRETLACLMDMDFPVQYIYGNGEIAVLETLAGKEPIQVPEPYRPIIRWNAQQLGPEHQRLMRDWAKTLRLDIPGIGNVLFCHATPRNESECFTRLTPEDHLLPMFEEIDAALVVCGHTHMQFDRMVGKVRVVNAGSIGMPFGEPGADWLLLGPDIQLQHTSYNLADAAERIRATNYPQSNEFAARNVLQPPSEKEMLEVFARAELVMDPE